MKSRITIVFDGAKFDYEVLISKETIINELNSVKSVRGFLHFTDINDNEIRITPSKIPLLEIEALEGDSDEF